MRFSFDRSQTLVMVEVRVRGPLGLMVADFALDTGAVQSMMDESLLRVLGYDVDSARSVEIATAGGRARATEVHVTNFSALGVTVSDMAVLASSLPYGIDGLLGLDFLRVMRLGIDFRDGVIEFD